MTEEKSTINQLMLNTSRYRSIALLLLFGSFSPFSYSQERWFQIEVSIFTNENLGDRAEEQWIPGPEPLNYPDSIRRLNELQDILLINDLLPAENIDTNDSLDQPLNPQQAELARLAEERAEQISRIGPQSATNGNGFRFFDLQRDSFLQLPAGQSDFQQTNRALRRSSDHRLLFHGLWRQPVLDPGLATPIFVSGGDSFGEYQELMGSLKIEFNEGRTRVVIDADLWLSEFTSVPPLDTETSNSPQWQIPLPPESIQEQRNSDQEQATQYYPANVYHMKQSREMRSTEFHYLDHPALGIVVMVEPYELPEAPPPGFSVQDALPQNELNEDNVQ